MFRPKFIIVGCTALALAMLVAQKAVPADSNSAVPTARAPAQSAKAVTKPADANDDRTAQRRKQITGEAVSAVGETHAALKALDDGKKDDALAALARATGKLELILAREPKLALAPVDVRMTSVDVLASSKKVNDIRRDAERMLEDGEVQAARHLLDGLASEDVISVSNIPLASYPDAIKQAVRAIDAGKQDEAKTVLQTALNTLVITETVVPHPIVAAQLVLKDAETLAAKSKRTEEENKRLSELLAQARAHLDFAQALGYGTKTDFKDMYAQLDQISEKTSSGMSGSGLFTRIKESLASITKSSQRSSK